MCLFVGNLANLKVLDLRNNRLTAQSIPPEIAKLGQLNKLFLSANVLAELPGELGQLRNLKVYCLLCLSVSYIKQELEISNNALTQLPSELGYLGGLERLNVAGNKLTSVPNTIGNLVNLIQLDLKTNEIASIPPEFGNLKVDFCYFFI